VVAELSLTIPHGPDAPGEVRKALRRLHPELPAELMHTVALLASELVANAVRHTSSAAIAVLFRVTPACVRVEVGDEGGRTRPMKRLPKPGKPGGWGLYIVDQLASRWGVSDAVGARVWFEVDR
jgi:anti-sigma regulatory factor (Ser/Thr protein kinase)